LVLQVLQSTDLSRLEFDLLLAASTPNVAKAEVNTDAMKVASIFFK
jgi:hypothetical protein